jgi:carbonic anhydrase
MKNIAITKQVQEALTPNNVLQDLLEGNNRFVNGSMQAVDNSALVNQTVGGQFPKAVVLSCIDSRVPVETVLDQAIGDIFVARVAGNFENIDILGSLEYKNAEE